MSRRLVLGALLGLALAGGLLWQHGRTSARGPDFGGARPLNVILLVIDTLRSDHFMGRAGEVALMPATHAFARRGVLFPNAVAPAPWTLPSMASLLTGVMPSEHRVELMPQGAPRLGPVSTWAQVFTARGYQTAAYTGGPWSWSAPGSLLEGFQPGSAPLHLGQPFGRLETWHRGLDPRRPFFLLLHSFEAHDPYGPEQHPAPGQRPPSASPGFDPSKVLEPAERARRFMLNRTEREALQTLFGNAFMTDVVRYLWSGYREEPRVELAQELARAYAEGVRWVDGLTSSVLTWLEARGLLQDTVLILTSDHGEAFGEHGFLEHGRQAFDEVVRVPLALLGPGPLSRGQVIPATVSLMDALPTAVELSGGALPSGITGRSLLPVIEGREGGRIALVEERMNWDVTGEDVDLALRALRSDRWKAIATWDLRTNALRWQVYDLVADPAEQHDLTAGTGALAGLALDPAFRRAAEELEARLAAQGARPVGAR